MPQKDVAQGLELLENLPFEEVDPAFAVDVLEQEEVASSYEVQKRILNEARQKGVIAEPGVQQNEETPSSSSLENTMDSDADVITKAGEYTCNRCGTGISEGYFISSDFLDIGPYGSTCIDKVLGRD